MASDFLGWSVNLIHSYLCKFMGKCSIGHPSASVPILGPITSQFKFPRSAERERDNPGHRMDTGWHSSWQNDAWNIFYSPAISKFALEQSFIIGVPTWTSVTVATQMKEELQEVNTLTTYDHLYIRRIRSWFCRFEEGGMQNFGMKSWKLKALDKYRSLCVSTSRLLYNGVDTWLPLTFKPSDYTECKTHRHSSILVEVQIAWVWPHIFSKSMNNIQKIYIQLQKSWMPSVRKHDVQAFSWPRNLILKLSWLRRDQAPTTRFEQFHMVSTRSPSTRSWKGENPYWYGLEFEEVFSLWNMKWFKDFSDMIGRFLVHSSVI